MAATPGGASSNDKDDSSLATKRTSTTDKQHSEAAGDKDSGDRAPKRSKRNSPVSTSVTSQSLRRPATVGRDEQVDVKMATAGPSSSPTNAAPTRQSVTQSLLRAGAQPITDLDKQFGMKFVQRAPSTTAPNAQSNTSAAGSAANSEPMDDRALAQLKQLDPSNFITHFWRHNVATHHLPRFELSQNKAQATRFGCSLFVYMPPNHSRAYVTPTTYVSKTEAKDAASRMAIQDGAPERARAARSLAGDESRDSAAQTYSGSHYDTVENPVGVLHEAVQKFAITERPSYDYTVDRLTDLHGVIVTCPISSTSSKQWQVDAVYSSRRDAKDAVTRLALKDGIIELYHEHASSRASTSAARSGPSLPSRASATAAAAVSQLPPDVRKDAIEVLNREALAAFGSVKCLKWNVKYAHKALEGEAEPTLLVGVDLHVVLGPLETRVYSVEPSFKDLNHARTTVASKALSEGVVEALRVHAGENPAAPPVLSHAPITQAAVSSAATLTAQEVDTMPDPVSYLNLFMQKWTATTAPLAFDYPPTTGGFKCTLSLNINGATFRYMSPLPCSSKKLAKESAVRRALREGVTCLVDKPFSTGANPALSTNPSPTSAARSTSTTTNNVEPAAPAPAIAAPPVKQIGNAAGTTCMEQLDKLFDNYALDGSLPEYVTNRDPRTGLFGASVQIPSLEGMQTVTVTDVHPTRLAAQEAVAVQVFKQGLHKRIKTMWQQSNPPRARPAVKDDELSGPFATKIVSVCEVLFDEDESKRPVFEVVSRSDDGPFGATMSLDLAPDDKVTCSIDSNYATPLEAIEAVAEQAIQDESVLVKIKAVVAKTSLPQPVSTKSSGGQTAATAARPTARSLYEDQTDDGPAPQTVFTEKTVESVLDPPGSTSTSAGAALATRPTSQASSATERALAPISLAPEVAAAKDDLELQPTAAESSSQMPSSSYPNISALEDYCTSKGLPAPVYHVEPAPSASVTTTMTNLTVSQPRIYITIGHTKFELPPSKKQSVKVRDVDSMKERLAGKIVSYIKSGKDVGLGSNADAGADTVANGANA
ncbi:hypothetical protein ACM66B_006453 [Microbotryomycetes sp. NB124-2]